MDVVSDDECFPLMTLKLRRKVSGVCLVCCGQFLLFFDVFDAFSEQYAKYLF